MKRTHLAGVVGLVISVALLWWALRDTDLGSILDRAGDADRPLMALAILLGVASMPLRAARWRQALVHLGDEQPTIGASYHATVIGAFANNVLPARAGEVVGVAALRQLSGVGVVEGGSSLALTHVVDIAVLVLLGTIGILVDPPVGGLGDADTVRNVLLIGVGVLVVGVVVVWAIVQRAGRMDPDTVVGGIAQRVGSGLGVVGHRRGLIGLVWWTSAVWVTMAVAWWVGLRALGVDLSFAAVLLTQTVVAIGIALPSAPGFFGPFESAARIAIGLYVVDAEAAAEAAVALHVAVFFLPVVVAGAASLLVTGLRPAHLRRLPEERVVPDMSAAGAR